MAWLMTALLSLGANIMGPAVLLVEYEPVPAAFALPFVIFSLAMVAWTNGGGPPSRRRSGSLSILLPPLLMARVLG